MTSRHIVQLTANFERNLEELEAFLTEAEAPQAFDALLDELVDIVIPNLESFPGMGRLFLERPVCSVEVANSIARLTVVSQHVVPLEAKASSGRPVLNSGVRSMEVVMMHPGRQFVSAML